MTAPDQPRCPLCLQRGSHGLGCAMADIADHQANP